jgi:hypothetical protein
MKVCLKNTSKLFKSEEIKILSDLVKFLQKDLPLEEDTYITFLKNRKLPMTTGVRYPNHEIYVLSNRLLIDVVRTLIHEWVHEFQHQKMGLSDDDKIQDIGGPEENMANVLAGIFTKKFQKEYPDYEVTLYGESDSSDF